MSNPVVQFIFNFFVNKRKRELTLERDGIVVLLGKQGELLKLTQGNNILLQQRCAFLENQTVNLINALHKLADETGRIVVVESDSTISIFDQKNVN